MLNPATSLSSVFPATPGQPAPSCAPLLRRAGSAPDRDAFGAALDDDTSPVDWSEEDVVFLHWRLLQEVRHLADPETPLEEKFDTLRWVFTEREKDGAPFSFVSCLRVVGCSPLSPIACRMDALTPAERERRREVLAALTARTIEVVDTML